MDAGGEKPMAVDLEECDFVLRETSISYVGEIPEAGSEVTH